MKKRPARKSKKLIRSFEDLHAMVQSYGDGHYIFRGERSTDYVLRPKYGRSAASILDEANDIERAVLDSFIRRGRPYISPAPASDWEWLAVAQHYGLATRLLDWTENPLIATYFAVENYGVGDRVIYVLNRNSFNVVDPTAPLFGLKEVEIFEPSHISDRIAAQAGLFTVHPRPADIFSHPSLDRWVISDSAIIDLHIALDRYGFNRSTVFPGLDGIAYHVNDWHLRGDRED